MTLTLDKVCVRLGRHEVLRGLTWSPQRRGIVGLIGPNGAGKSTLLDVLSGFLSAESGCVTWQGQPVSRRRLVSIAARLHQVDVIADITGTQLLAIAKQPQIFARYWEQDGALDACLKKSGKIADVFAQFAGLDADFHRKHLSEMSGGQRRAIGTLAAVTTGKPLILLDEPFAGLAEATAAHLIRWLRKETRDRLVIIAEHDIGRLSAAADTIVGMSGGKIGGVFARGTSRKELLRFFL